MNTTIQTHMNNRNVQIGNICIQFTHLELLLAQAIWSALDLTEKAGLSVTGRLDIEARAKLAVEICEERGKPDSVINELKNVRKELQASRIIERRNQAVHGHRFSDPDNPAAELVVVHRGKNAGAKIKRADNELAQLGKDIAALHKPLMEAMTTAKMTY
ncbi:hypothetical protein [Maritalea mediterranea]|uniref:Cthe-2314-like HEPN domain-containing protein n=1 Tax=Maritalea mediterranea TaxID=2909667 RepID=A0ABS9E6W2_9HYPH|nr:hypothetical protein [Maritalea mediterranea]MCF4098614.1 hypothetical protein [Maritalea mediterranea]